MCVHVSPGRNTGQIMRPRLPKWATGRDEAGFRSIDGERISLLGFIVLKLRQGEIENDCNK